MDRKVPPSRTQACSFPYPGRERADGSARSRIIFLLDEVAGLTVEHAIRYARMHRADDRETGARSLTDGERRPFPIAIWSRAVQLNECVRESHPIERRFVI